MDLCCWGEKIGTVCIALELNKDLEIGIWRGRIFEGGLKSYDLKCVGRKECIVVASSARIICNYSRSTALMAFSAPCV